jgi:hypothetical protein
VRVQSKNYLTPIAKFEKNAQQDLLLRARLLENEDIGSFFERMNRAKSLTFSNLNDIAYVIANEAWFSTAGNIRQKHLGLAAEDHDVESMSLHQNMIDYVLSEALLNYLGIIAVKQMNGSNAIDFNYSNIFFMVGNRQLLPTYKIVEGLIQNLKDWTKNTYTLSVQLNRKKLNFKAKDATNLLKSKEEAVASEGGFSNLNYNNSSLVDVGTKIGAKVIENLSISSINLEVSLKALFDSSYSFY